MFCTGINDIHHKEAAGEKAYNLHSIHKLGIGVPNSLFLHVSAFYYFIEFNNLGTILQAADNVQSISDPEKKLELIKRFQTNVLDAVLPESIWIELADKVSKQFGAKKLIIRSSARGEDSGAASFAGQLDSFHTDGSLPSLRNSVLKCWASYWSERCIFYQITRNVKLEGMGIIIQELIPSELSGVLFTEYYDGNGSLSHRMIAEFCSGHGDQLVSGKINPGCFQISKNNMIHKMISTPESIHLRKAHHSAIKDLGRIALRLENEYQSPQDIEWTIDSKGQLYILQTRPITTPVVHTEQATETLTVWSNVNVNENYPAPIKPFLFSIARKGYYYYFRNLGKSFGVSEKIVRSMDQPLSEIVGLHGARMYYNLSNIYACLNVLPLSDKIIKYWNIFIGVYNTTPGQHQNAAPTKPQHYLYRKLFVLRIFFVTFWTFLFLPLRIRRFIVTVDHYVTESKISAQKGSADYANDLRSFLDIRFDKWRNAALADAAAMFTYGLLKSFTSRWLEVGTEHEVNHVHNSLLHGITGLESNIPSQKIWELSQIVRRNAKLNHLMMTSSSETLLKSIYKDEAFKYFREEMIVFLINWGFRCSGELMLSEPNYQETPEKLLEIIKSYLHCDAISPFENAQNQKLRRREIARNVKLALRKQSLGFLKVWMLNLLTALAHVSIRYREKVRSRQASLYNRCREILINTGVTFESGHVIEKAEDIFYLEYTEILKGLDNQTNSGPHTIPDLRNLIKRRKLEFSIQSQYSPPETFILKAGEVYSEHDRTHQDQAEQLINQPPMAQKFFKGLSASGGKVTGKAVVLKDIREAGQINRHDILVARQTDPGWGPIFPLIKGIVMERGGMLSHGAIIAREYGIPAVVGVENATNHFKACQNIIVDGDRGSVEILS